MTWITLIWNLVETKIEKFITIRPVFILILWPITDPSHKIKYAPAEMNFLQLIS